MRWLLFLGRVAFICNIFFILCVLFRFTNMQLDQALTGFVVVGGWILAPVFCLVFNVALIVSYYLKKIRPGTIPKWLVSFNLIMMVVQLIVIPFK